MLVFVGLHSSKEDNAYSLEKAFEGNGLGEVPHEVDRNFVYALGEVEFELDVDVETGEYKIVGISGDTFDENSILVNGRRYWNMDRF